jgi:hypothetical protein
MIARFGAGKATHRRGFVTARALVVALPLWLATATSASVASTVHAILTVNGATVLDESRSGTSFSVAFDRTINSVAARLEGRVFQSGDLGLKATVSGNVAASARVTGTSQATYRLSPPPAASFAGGTLVVRATLAGQILGGATMDLAVGVEAFTLDWSANGSDARSIVNQPGDDTVALDVIVALPASLDPAGMINVLPTINVDAVASIAGGATQSSSFDALNSAQVTGFRVLNAAGVQVSGFRLSAAGKEVPELAPAPAGQGLAVEFYHAAFEHYFVTANGDEIAKLDTGVIAGWHRTGESFGVFIAAAAGRVPVCRFFSTAFGAKSSHFYAPQGLGCEAVLNDPAWTFEGDVFLMMLPDNTGQCPEGTVPVYRLYNDGQGGAPNHRFTTSEDTRLDMLRDGYVAEGAGIGVGMCAPAP